MYTQLWGYKINRFLKNNCEVDYNVHLQYITKLLICNQLRVGQVLKPLPLPLPLPLPYTKCHTIVCLLLATKMFLVNLEQTSSCKFSTDHKLHSLLLWNFVKIFLVFCKNLLVLIYSKLKEKTHCQNKVSDFLEYQYSHFIFSQFVIVEHNSRKNIWVSLNVLSYLCSV